jgi:tripartite ATP-independent transporter DctM subunit
MKSFVALILALTGVPLFAVMALSALISHHEAEIDLQAVIISFYQLGEIALLSTLPLFAFSGYLLARSNAPRRLLRVSRALVGWLPGGLAIVAVWMCSLLTAMTGASGVTIIALGGLLLPAMLEDRYEENFSLGVLTSGGSLGLLFPPSVPVILYGVVAGVSIEDLFLAGLLPGLLILTLLSLYSGFCSSRMQVPRQAFSVAELLTALRESIWEIPLPIFILIGIYSGQITVTEAAVTSAAYLLVVELLVYREVSPGDVGTIARESMVLTGAILIILGMAMAVTNYVIDAEIPRKFFEMTQEYMTSQFAFLLALNIFLLFVGCMIDIFAAIAIIVPLIIPIAQEYDVNLVHLGIVFLTNMGIGYATPPVGLNLFIAAVRFKQPILKLYWACLPFILILLVALGLITYIPELSLMFID